MARAPMVASLASGAALLAAAAALLAATAPRAPAAPAPARATGPPKCATSSLVMWLNPEDSGTLGSFYYHLELANLSGHTCTLAGYPGVSAVSLGGRQIGAAAAREPGSTPRTVTLAPEAQTTALIHLVDVGALPASCRPAAAAGFRVYPPGQTSSKVVPFPFRTCANVAQRALLVRAVKTE
jgi:hypothetical protein